MPDPKKKKATAARSGKKTDTYTPQPEKVKSRKTGKIENVNSGDVTGRTVKKAKAGTGTFKAPPPFKGKLVRGDGKNISGYKNNKGEFTRATGPEQRRALKKRFESEKKLYDQKAKRKNAQTSRIANAEYKETKYK